MKGLWHQGPEHWSPFADLSHRQLISWGPRFGCLSWRSAWELSYLPPSVGHRRPGGAEDLTDVADDVAFFFGPTKLMQMVQVDGHSGLPFLEVSLIGIWHEVRSWWSGSSKSPEKGGHGREWWRLARAEACIDSIHYYPISQDRFKRTYARISYLFGKNLGFHLNVPSIKTFDYLERTATAAQRFPYPKSFSSGINCDNSTFHWAKWTPDPPLSWLARGYTEVRLMWSHLGWSSTE